MLTKNHQTYRFKRKNVYVELKCDMWTQTAMFLPHS